MKYLIIADDLTGANASAVLLAKLGIKSLVIFHDSSTADLESYDLLSVATSSRNIEASSAYKIVYETISRFYRQNLLLVNKRVDSTLRGNIGAEIDAILDFEKDSVGFVVPAYPDSGRITVGGRMLVNGKPLQETDVSKDPGSPIKTSNVINLISKQTKYKVTHIPIEILLSEKVNDFIKEEYSTGSKLFVFDAVTNEHIDKIADAALLSGLRFITIDPGPFNASVVKKIHSKGKVLFLIGSTTDLTLAQVEQLQLKGIPVIEVDIPRFLILEEENLVKEVKAFVNELIVDSSGSLCIKTCKKIQIEEYSKRLRISSESVVDKINKIMALIGKEILEKSPYFTGIFVSGGDTTRALMKFLDAQGVNVLGEIYPLVSFGKIVGGPFEGLKIVTKGGLVGQNDTLLRSLDYLWGEKT